MNYSVNYLREIFLNVVHLNTILWTIQSNLTKFFRPLVFKYGTYKLLILRPVILSEILLYIWTTFLIIENLSEVQFSTLKHYFTQIPVNLSEITFLNSFFFSSCTFELPDLIIIWGKFLSGRHTVKKLNRRISR